MYVYIDMFYTSKHFVLSCNARYVLFVSALTSEMRLLAKLVLGVLLLQSWPIDHISIQYKKILVS